MAQSRIPRIMFPFDPVVDRICAQTDKRRPSGASRHRKEHELTITDIAMSVGVTRRTIHRYLKAGMIPELTADRVAVAIGEHPLALWADYHDRTAGSV